MCDRRVRYARVLPSESRDDAPESSAKGPESADGPPPLLPETEPGTLIWRIRGLLRTMRPHQWVKNVFVLAPVVFAKHVTDPALIRSAAGAFGVFCLLAAAVYTMNDIVDVEADRLHPVKRKRPIASGQLPLGMAKGLVIALLMLGFGGALLGPTKFTLTVVTYFVLNVVYSFRLKRVPYVDVVIIATGFVLRVLAGGFATGTWVSRYMLACTMLLALFLGFGKRRHELASTNFAKQRAALAHYSVKVLNAALTVTGLGSVGVYLAYTLDEHTQEFFRNHSLWMTTVHPVFGVVRFLQLVAWRPRAESPTQEMLRDTPFVLNVVAWVIEVVMVVYRLRPS